MHPIKPKKDEIWFHEQAGIVMIVKPWGSDTNESVCDTSTGRRILRHEFMAGQLLQNEDGETWTLHLRSGEILPIPEDTIQLRERA